MNIPAELKYTKDHEWVKIDGDVATIGITDFAQRELGDNRALYINRRLCTHVFNAVFPVVAEIIKTKAVHFGVDDLE